MRSLTAFETCLGYQLLFRDTKHRKVYRIEHTKEKRYWGTYFETRILFFVIVWFVQSRAVKWRFCYETCLGPRLLFRGPQILKVYRVEHAKEKRYWGTYFETRILFSLIRLLVLSICRNRTTSLLVLLSLNPWLQVNYVQADRPLEFNKAAGSWRCFLSLALCVSVCAVKKNISVSRYTTRTQAVRMTK